MNFKENILFSIHCAVLGDIIGFGNGNVEFNFNSIPKIESARDIDKISSYSNRHVVDFISKGGFTKIDLSKDIASDDSILLLAVFDALTPYNSESDVDKIIENIVVKIIEYMENDKKRNERFYGVRTINSINRIGEGKKWNKFAYSERAGGCGASIRSMAIGLKFHESSNFDKLLEISIQSSRITHNNPIGYLGGFVSALFTSYAIQKINPEEWIFKLVKILHGDDIYHFIKNYVVKEFPNELDKHTEDFFNFKDLCDKYVELRFKDNKFLNLSKNISMRFFEQRSQFYYNHFGSGLNKENVGYSLFNPGSNGFDSVIIAYDCLLDCNGSFETLIYYSMLHAGDSDSTGCIAGALFGAYYGKFDLPNNMYNIEFFDTIKKLVDKY